MTSTDIKIRCFRKIIKITWGVEVHLEWFSSIAAELRKMLPIFYSYQCVPKQQKRLKYCSWWMPVGVDSCMCTEIQSVDSMKMEWAKGIEEFHLGSAEEDAPRGTISTVLFTGFLCSWQAWVGASGLLYQGRWSPSRSLSPLNREVAAFCTGQPLVIGLC